MTPHPTPTPLPPAVRAELEHTLEHFNGNHADTVLFMARHCGGVPSATDAEAVDVDGEGVVTNVVVAGATIVTRLPFEASATSVPEVQAQVLGMIGAARRSVGDREPLTSIERERLSTDTLLTHLTTVVEVSDLSPNIRRIVVQDGLDDYEPLGADDFAYLFAPRHPDDVTITDGFDMRTYQAMPESARPYGAYYTVRRFDPSARSITLWAVLHGHDTGVGGWAARAEPGATVALWGPRRSYYPPEGDFHHLFLADESGLAAVCALLDGLEPHITATVVAETVDRNHEFPLNDRPGTDVVWLHRGGAAPGRSTGFLPAVRTLNFDPVTTVAFGAGESRQITAVRKYLRHDLAMASDRVFMTGYWRR